MRKLLMGMAILSTLAVAGVSQAAIGTVDLSWDGCTGPIDKTTTTPGFYSIFITELGHDQPHKAYDVRIIYGDANQTVPDAWRFDADGCEGTSLITQDVTSKLCPPFWQNVPGALQIKKVEFSPPQDGYATTLMRVLLANAYSDVSVVNPATRYLLEVIKFDLNAAVVGAGSPPITCGGMEVPMCFKLSYATWLDLAGNEIPFNRGITQVSWQGPSACPAVPVLPKTWGSIKNQYRN
jgi:hypothetical protein